MQLEKVDRTGNEFRAYRIELTRSLFGDWGVDRNWGRIGTKGRSRIDWFETKEAAGDAASTILRQKLNRGYRLRSDF